ncbi:hypothetical protein PG984_016472 [Apiospora sp. TS-2023a]
MGHRTRIKALFQLLAPFVAAKGFPATIPRRARLVSKEQVQRASAKTTITGAIMLNTTSVILGWEAPQIVWRHVSPIKPSSIIESGSAAIEIPIQPSLFTLAEEQGFVECMPHLMVLPTNSDRTPLAVHASGYCTPWLS